MSWDVDLVIDTGAEEKAAVLRVGNMTYNVSPMYYDALGGEGLRGFHGKNAGESVVALTAGVRQMEDHPEKYRAMNPSNGWGSYEGALRFLREIRDACAKHPKCEIEIS